MSYTHALMVVPRDVYDVFAKKLREHGYNREIYSGNNVPPAIDLHGLAIAPEDAVSATHCPRELTEEQWAELNAAALTNVYLNAALSMHASGRPLASALAECSTLMAHELDRITALALKAVSDHPQPLKFAIGEVQRGTYGPDSEIRLTVLKEREGGAAPPFELQSDLLKLGNEDE